MTQMAWQGTGQIKRWLLGLDQLARIATVAHAVCLCIAALRLDIRRSRCSMNCRPLAAPLIDPATDHPDRYALVVPYGAA
jgi:hypothetical protein